MRATLRLAILLPGLAVSLVSLMVISEPATSQEKIWTRQFGTTNEDGQGSSADPFGNIYVHGYTQGALPGETFGGAEDAFLRKYDDNGNEVCTDQFEDGDWERSHHISFDSAGNVYVPGHSSGELSGQSHIADNDAYLRKYDSNCNEIWTRLFGTTGNDSASAASVHPLDDNVIFIAGTVTGALPGQTAAGGRDIFVRSYDATGNAVCTNQLGSPGGGFEDSAYQVTADTSGEFYVSGVTFGALPGQATSGDADAFIAKFDASCNVLWIRQFGTTWFDDARSLTATSGVIYVAGSADGVLPGETSAGGTDAYVRKYDSSGNVVWTRQFGTAQADRGFSVDTDSSGNVYVSGDTGGDIVRNQPVSQNGDVFFRRYNASGVETCTVQFGDMVNKELTGYVSLDPSDEIFLSGRTDGALPGQTYLGAFDIFVTKLSSPDPDDFEADGLVDDCDPDDDNDGCTDVAEQQPKADAATGGYRNPKNPYDFFDTNGDRYIDLTNDILGVILRYSANPTLPYDPAYDRGPLKPITNPNPWNRTAPDGWIDLANDILSAILQYQHDCR